MANLWRKRSLLLSNGESRKSRQTIVTVKIKEIIVEIKVPIPGKKPNKIKGMATMAIKTNF